MDNSTERIIQAITLMLEGFPSQAASDLDLQLRAYLVAVGDHSAKVVEEACRRFICGEDGRENTRFPPTTAQLAKLVRDISASMRPAISTTMVDLECPISRARRKARLDDAMNSFQALPEEKRRAIWRAIDPRWEDRWWTFQQAKSEIC